MRCSLFSCCADLFGCKKKEVPASGRSRSLPRETQESTGLSRRVNDFNPANMHAVDRELSGVQDRLKVISGEIRAFDTIKRDSKRSPTEREADKRRLGGLQGELMATQPTFVKYVHLQRKKVADLLVQTNAAIESLETIKTTFYKMPPLTVWSTPADLEAFSKIKTQIEEIFKKIKVHDSNKLAFHGLSVTDREQARSELHALGEQLRECQQTCVQYVGVDRTAVSILLGRTNGVLDGPIDDIRRIYSM